MIEIDNNEIDDILTLPVNRLNHILRVVSNSIILLKQLNISEKSVLYKKVIASAYLHDIGYLTKLNKEDFHPYDGYVYLKSLGYDNSILNVVLHHTYAEKMVEMNGEVLSEAVKNVFKEISFECLNREDKFIYDLITMSDMLSDGNGELVTIEQRIFDIGERHGYDSIIYKHIKIFEDKLKSSNLYLNFISINDKLKL